MLKTLLDYCSLKAIWLLIGLLTFADRMVLDFATIEELGIDYNEVRKKVEEEHGCS